MDKKLLKKLLIIIGGFVGFLILFIIIISIIRGISNKKTSYEKIKSNAVVGAQKYYDSLKEKLNSGESMEISFDELIAKKYMDEYASKLDDGVKCSGKVIISNRFDTIVYTSNMDCGKYSEYKDDSEQDAWKNAYSITYQILKHANYYSLDLNGTTTREFENMSKEEQEKIDYLIDDIDDETGYYLDLDISFFEKQIKQKEQELNLSHKKKDYFDSSITDLMRMFNKSKTAVKTAISRMTKRTGINYKYILDGEIIIKAAGVKWLYEKYFRLAYLEYLENYKLDLDKKVLELYGR